MEEQNCQCNELEQNAPRTLSACWGNQLERIKEGAERESDARKSESHGAQDLTKSNAPCSSRSTPAGPMP